MSSKRAKMAILHTFFPTFLKVDPQKRIRNCTFKLSLKLKKLQNPPPKPLPESPNLSPFGWISYQILHHTFLIERTNLSFQYWKDKFILSIAKVDPQIWPKIGHFQLRKWRKLQNPPSKPLPESPNLSPFGWIHDQLSHYTFIIERDH